MKNFVAIALAFVCIGVGFPRAVALHHGGDLNLSADHADSPLFFVHCGRSVVESAKFLASTTFWNCPVALARDGGDRWDAAGARDSFRCLANSATLRSQQVLLRL